jgi:hypothetical protein
MNNALKWTLVIAVIVGIGLLGWVALGMPTQLAITPAGGAKAIEYDGELDAEWITTTDNEFYSDSTTSADFVEIDEDEEIKGNITLTNFTASGQDRQFAMKVMIDAGPVKDFKLSFDTATTFAEDNVTVSSLDLVGYDPDDNMPSKSYTIKDNEVDQTISVVDQGDYVLVGIIRSLTVGNSSVATLFNGEIEAKNPDADDEVSQITFDIRGGALVS